jgi:hypothetical protein
MSASSALLRDAAEDGAGASPLHDVEEALSIADLSAALGISDAGVAALASAGLLGAVVAPARFARRIVDDLAERIWRAALPTESAVPCVRLRDAVEAGSGPEMWPEVIAALLDGRINAFRRRGAFGGPVLVALVVSSERVVAEIAPAPGDGSEAPFIWTPTIAN